RSREWLTLTLALPFCSLSGSTAAPFPTLAPPLTMVVNGERKTLVVCVVNDLSQDTADAIWFSNENGSALDSFTYGVSREEDGTFSTVSHLSIHTAELESWESLACHVRQNRTAQVWSARSLLISGRYQAKRISNTTDPISFLSLPCPHLQSPGSPTFLSISL
uniref:Ig-like domain-containing protein n=1 Tax=Gopherus agassizii TaxID=38772 RepID=A0A452GJR9_9SAUR